METHVTDLRTMTELGRGAYGVVEKMVHTKSGLAMAVKVRLVFHIWVFIILTSPGNALEMLKDRPCCSSSALKGSP